MFSATKLFQIVLPVPVINIARFLSGITSVDCEWEQRQLDEACKLIENEIKILKIPSFKIRSTHFITCHYALTEFGYSPLAVRLLTPGIRKEYDTCLSQHRANYLEVRREHFEQVDV